jgi:hypothetical protein
MSKGQLEQLDPRLTSALNELTTTIRARYPDAQFEVASGVDDPGSIHLTTTVDIKETEDIIDLVIDCLLELQVEEQLPIHVIPLRPLERTIVVEQPSVSQQVL